MGRENWRFIGHPKEGLRSSIIYAVAGNCRLLGIVPLAYLTDVARQEGEPVDDLLPR